MTDKLTKTLSEINFSDYGSLINTTSFLAYSFDEYNFSKQSKLKLNEKNALQYSSLLLLIAGIHYSIIYSNTTSIQSEILIRYSDWLLTTPLLLKVITSYYDLPNKISNELILYNFIMIISGLIYELTNNIYFWFLGILAYLVLVYRLYILLPKHDLFLRYFIIGWGLYGFVSLMKKDQRLKYYNILDLYNKLVFAIEIRTHIQSNINRR
jgi:hypothetical protein